MILLKCSIFSQIYFAYPRETDSELNDMEECTMLIKSVGVFFSIIELTCIFSDFYWVFMRIFLSNRNT